MWVWITWKFGLLGGWAPVSKQGGRGVSVCCLVGDEAEAEAEGE